MWFCLVHLQFNRFRFLPRPKSIFKKTFPLPVVSMATNHTQSSTESPSDSDLKNNSARRIITDSSELLPDVDRSISVPPEQMLPSISQVWSNCYCWLRNKTWFQLSLISPWQIKGEREAEIKYWRTQDRTWETNGRVVIDHCTPWENVTQSSRAVFDSLIQRGTVPANNDYVLACPECWDGGGGPTSGHGQYYREGFVECPIPLSIAYAVIRIRRQCWPWECGQGHQSPSSCRCDGSSWSSRSRLRIRRGMSRVLSLHGCPCFPLIEDKLHGLVGMDCSLNLTRPLQSWDNRFKS